MRSPMCILTVLALTLLVGGFAQDEVSPPSAALPTTKAAIANSAVQTLSEVPDSTKTDVLTNIKTATDGIQLAIQSGVNKDTSKMLKGIGDAVSVLPGAFGFAGIGFSVAASVFAVVGSSDSKADPVLTALHDLHASFTKEMDAIQSTLQQVHDQVGAVIAGIDRILHEISDLPTKVVAEMKLTDVTTMKDKFAVVHGASLQYAHGNLTRDQMAAKCDDFGVAALFSELGTILKDDKRLFATAFGTQDHAHGLVQARLLVFYLSVVPVVTNCNALKYSLASLKADGEAISRLVRFAYARAVWYLAEPDRTVRVREAFNPFATAIDVDGKTESDSGRMLSLSFKAYSFAPPHAACFEVIAGGKGVESRTLGPAAKVPNNNTFCTKNTQTDDAPHRIVYAERIARDGSGVAVVQLERDAEFDPLNGRGWTRNVLAMYAHAGASHWTRLPLLHVISDVVLLQADNDKVSIDEITNQCRARGDGYDRSGDAHSKDYSGAPWTIFCVQSTTLTLREVDATTPPLLSEIQFNDMEARAAHTATCATDKGFARDAGQVTLPSKIKKQFLGGASTVRAFAVCLKYERMTSSSTPSQFVDRVWLDDSAPMAEKPKYARHTGDTRMALPAP